MSIGKSQGQIFLEGEGDGYYDRNKSALEKESHFYCEEVLCNELLHFREEIKQIVEVGCSSGVKLEYHASSLLRLVAASSHRLKQLQRAVRDCARLEFKMSASKLAQLTRCPLKNIVSIWSTSLFACILLIGTSFSRPSPRPTEC
jgi:hypothetical protein